MTRRRQEPPQIARDQVLLYRREPLGALAASAPWSLVALSKDLVQMGKINDSRRPLISLGRNVVFSSDFLRTVKVNRVVHALKRVLQTTANGPKRVFLYLTATTIMTRLILSPYFCQGKFGK